MRVPSAGNTQARLSRIANEGSSGEQPPTPPTASKAQAARAQHRHLPPDHGGRLKDCTTAIAQLDSNLFGLLTGIAPPLADGVKITPN